jgi:hypothetical protein
LGASFIGIGPSLSSSPQGPYSCEAQPLTIIVQFLISKGLFSPDFNFYFYGIDHFQTNSLNFLNFQF